MFNFTPLLGAQSTSPASQSLLEFEGGVKVLVDVGWDSDFDVAKLKGLERHVPTLSIILLTHATSAHIAAFAHCCKHVPLFSQIPIYATTPVISLGRTLVQDLYASTPLASSIIPNTSLSESSYTYSSLTPGDNLQILLQPPTPEEIASYFALINPLKYSQPHQPLPSPFSPPLNGLTITAYNAGHTLGGTIWHIQHGMESVVYAVDWNQVRENVLSGAAWLGASGAGGAEVIEQLRKPTALICSTKGVEQTAAVGARVKRDELLLDMIRITIKRGGTVLIPIDTSARVLELAYVLDHAWRRESSISGPGNLRTAKVYLASRNVGATMRYARSMLEWMDENVVREFEAEAANSANTANSAGKHRRTDSKQMRNEQDNTNQAARINDTPGGPFEFKFIKLIERKSQVDKILSKKIPQVILASDASLQWGFSRDALHHLAVDPANLVILTERHQPKQSTNSEFNLRMSELLWKWFSERRDGVAVETGFGGQSVEQVYTDNRTLIFQDIHRQSLEGKELIVYQQYLATQRQLHTTLQSGNGALLESAADALDETSSRSSSSSEESDSEKQGKALNMSAALAQARNKLSGNKEVTGVNVLLRQPGVYDYDVRGRKGRDAMFPYVTKRRRLDDFGELIRPEDYLRAEERDEVDGHDMRDTDSVKQSGLGQKRKWEDPSLQSLKTGRSSLSSKKRKRTVEGESKNMSLHTNGGRTNGADHNETESSDDSETEVEEQPIGPSKIIYKDSSVQANLRIAYVDFAGLHDQRSLSMLIPLIQPRKLVLVGGTESETLWLARTCREKLRARLVPSEDREVDDVFTPLNGETVSASMDTNAWTVKLSQGLVRRLNWQDVKGLGIVTLMGRLAATRQVQHQEVESLRRKRQRTVKDEEEMSNMEAPPAGSKAASNLPPTLDILPTNMQAATRSVAQPIHVGDLRLAELRRILQSTGHSAEFRGEGILLIDEMVAVRKSGTGHVEVESGGPRISDLAIRDNEESFQTVKRRIYEGLAIIVG
ncbi:hypothetical protein MMC13_003719 [Lambiella insularis]|nr:hypothetical protein [Lambiella insularis]